MEPREPQVLPDLTAPPEPLALALRVQPELLVFRVQLAYKVQPAQLAFKAQLAQAPRAPQV